MKYYIMANYYSYSNILLLTHDLSVNMTLKYILKSKDTYVQEILTYFTENSELMICRTLFNNAIIFWESKV